MPATDSFTSTASAVSSATSTFTDGVMMSDGPGVSVDYSPRGFRVAEYQNKVQVTKATSFGGTQAALSLPLTLDDARDLADAFQRIVT